MIAGIVAAAFHAGEDEEPPPEETPPEVGSVVIYTGTGASLAITGVGLQPDAVLIKRRDGTAGWRWVNDARGIDNWTDPSSNGFEDVEAQGVTALGADGFTVGTAAAFNTAAATYVAYCLKETANAYNVTTYLGSDVTSVISHGLGVVPELIIIKNYWSGGNWIVYPGPLSASDERSLLLNSNGIGFSGSTIWLSTPPTSTQFTAEADTQATNNNGDRYFAHLFASVAGKTKVGSYTGTGAAGNAIACGFRPKFVLIKRTDASGDWLMFDEKRDPSAVPQVKTLSLNATTAENAAGGSVTFSDTGFEPTDPNVSAGTYLYLAVA
jgi:hypothetical protein